MKATKKCRKCGCDNHKTFYSEKRKNWIGILRWKCWCGDCYKERFCKDIESDPLSMAKYYNIYGKFPRDVIIQ